jgi:hypothetical protein
MTRDDRSRRGVMTRSAGSRSDPTTRSALQSALAAEHAAIYGYGVAGAHLTGTRQQAAQRDWAAHQLARDALEARLSSLGAQPVAAQDAYQLPFPVHGSGAAAALAGFLEDGMATAYLRLVALDDPGLRAWGARQVRASALRATSWTGRAAAFPGLPAAGATTSTPRPTAS